MLGPVKDIMDRARFC